jgi:hypothetical protein
MHTKVWRFVAFVLLDYFVMLSAHPSTIYLEIGICGRLFFTQFSASSSAS